MSVKNRVGESHLEWEHGESFCWICIHRDRTDRKYVSWAERNVGNIRIEAESCGFSTMEEAEVYAETCAKILNGTRRVSGGNADPVEESVLDRLRRRVEEDQQLLKKKDELLVGRDLEIQRLSEALKVYQADWKEASGELLIPVPEPGTVEAKLMVANRLLKHNVARLEKWLAFLRDTPDGDWVGHEECCRSALAGNEVPAFLLGRED